MFLRGIPIPKSTPVVVLIECANLGMEGAPSDAWDPLGLRQQRSQETARAAWTFGFGRRQCPATAYATRAMAKCESGRRSYASDCALQY